MREIQFFVEGQPVAKGRPRFSTVGGFPKAYTPKTTRDYEDRVTHCAELATNGNPATSSPVSVTLCFNVEIPKSYSKKKRELIFSNQLYPTKKPDIDNLAKAVMDGLNGVCFLDDSQVVSLTVHKRYSERVGVDVVVMIML